MRFIYHIFVLLFLMFCACFGEDEEEVLPDILGAKKILLEHDREISWRSEQEKRDYYERLLEERGITPNASPYAESKYIDSRFGDLDIEKKKKLSRIYSSADKKNGVFIMLSGGMGSIVQTYTDGLYNEKNNIANDDVIGSVCSDNDKSGCKRANVFIDGDKGIIFNYPLLSFGGGIGYQKFYNPFLGARIYGDGLINMGSVDIQVPKVDNQGKKSYSNSEHIGNFYYMLGGLNADLLIELPFSTFISGGFFSKFAIGAYAGLNIGVMMLVDESNDKMAKYMHKNANGASNDVLWDYLLQVDYGINLGVSLSFASRYKVDVGAKIPMSRIGQLPNSLRLGVESPAEYTLDGKSVELMSKDISYMRTPIYTISIIVLL